MTRDDFTAYGLAKIRHECLYQISGREDSYPRTWEHELEAVAWCREQHAQSERAHDWSMGNWSPDDPPTILGYEQLEREGLAVRIGIVLDSTGDPRVHFRATEAGIAAGENLDEMFDLPGDGVNG
jgi:hypothetical protein